jgi:hypothetical protein
MTNQKIHVRFIQKLEDVDEQMVDFLIHNFENLSSDEQNKLIAHLKKLGQENPQRFHQLIN